MIFKVVCRENDRTYRVNRIDQNYTYVSSNGNPIRIARSFSPHCEFSPVKTAIVISVKYIEYNAAVEISSPIFAKDYSLKFVMSFNLI